MKALALSKDQSLVLAADSEGGVAACRVADGKLQWSRAILSPATSIQFSADGKRIVLHCVDGTERALDLANGRNVLLAEAPKK